jgi:hypothetical protein
MRTNLKLERSEWSPLRPLPRRFASVDDDSEPDDADEVSSSIPSAQHEDLPYKVELWDAGKAAVEQLLAVSRNGSIGYAAFYEATRQFPNRYITLRHNGRVVSRFNGPTH